MQRSLSYDFLRSFSLARDVAVRSDSAQLQRNPYALFAHGTTLMNHQSRRKQDRKPKCQ